MGEEINIKEMPSWIKEIDDGKFEIEIKGKKYIMVERNGRVIEECNRLAQKTKVEFETLLARRSLEEPQLTDDDFEALPGSVYFKLKTAVAYVYGLNDFF